jgi:hypothetical protein
MPDLARRPFLKLSLSGLIASCMPGGAWAVRRPPPRADSPLVAVDPLLVLTGLTTRWQAAMRQDLGWAARWADMDSGQALAQLEQGQVHAGLFLTHPRADELAHQGLIHARRRIATTDVLLLGPTDDIAGIRGEADIARALTQIRAAVAAGAAAWQAPLPGSALDALAQPWAKGMLPPARADQPAPASRKPPPPAYRLMTRAEWLRQPPRAERLKIWSGADPRLKLHAEVACSYRARHEGAKLFVNWLGWPLAQGAVQAAQPAWQRVKQD